MIFLSLEQITSCLVIQVNFSSAPLNKKYINSPITNFSLSYGIFIYKMKETNAEIELALFFEFNLIVASITV